MLLLDGVQLQPADDEESKDAVVTIKHYFSPTKNVCIIKLYIVFICL